MTRERGILYFSPKFSFRELGFEKPDETIPAFRDRVYGFYLSPARQLAATGYAFASGAISCSAIDFLAQYSGVKGKERFEEWLCQNVPDFKALDSNKASSTIGRRFYEDFRCGLFHNGRIKNLGQFSLDEDSLITFDAKALVVNPLFLLEAIEAAFEKYCATFQTEAVAKALIARLRSDFRQEIETTR